MYVMWDLYPLLKQEGHIQEKQRAINQRPWMKQCCLWGKRKVSLFHTPSRGQDQLSTALSFNQRRKNGDMKNRGDPHQEQEKVKIGKNKRKVKRKENN